MWYNEQVLHIDIIPVRGATIGIQKSIAYGDDFESHFRLIWNSIASEIENYIKSIEPERKGLSADCKLPPEMTMAILMAGKEHPCDRCNHDRKICRGFPRIAERENEK